MFKKVFKSMDYGLIIIAVALFIIGIVALFSANGGVNGNTEEVSKQLLWFVAGIVCMFLIALVDYDLLRQILDTNIYFNDYEFSGSFIYRADKWRK